MPDEPEFADLEANFKRFQDMLEQLQQQLPPGHEEAVRVQGIREQLDSGFREFAAVCRAEDERLDQEIATLQARLTAAKKQASAAKAARERAESQLRPAAVPEPMPPLDPELGAKLRALLLTEFAAEDRPLAAARKPRTTAVAEMQSNEWSATDVPEVADKPPAPPPPPPPRQPRKPKVGGSSFEWESTDEW